MPEEPRDKTLDANVEGPRPQDGSAFDEQAAATDEFDGLPVITQEDLDRERTESKAPRGRKAADGDNFIKGSIGAMRKVRDVSKRHATARDKVKSLKDELDKSQKVLDRRVAIERDFDKIMAEQGAVLDTQQKIIQKADQETQDHQAEKATLERQLQQMKADHEEDLRPYRELMESTKGRSDDAAKTLAEAKRRVKSANQQLDDATKRREQNLSSANRSVDNSQERLRKAQDELSSLQRDDDAQPSVIQKKQSDLAAERAHLDAARADLERVTDEGRRLVENAQANLAAQRKALETAEAQADAAKREADASRGEYEHLYNDALAEEKILSENITRHERGIASCAKEREAAQSKAGKAQERLKEARDIHSTPEVTEDLARTIEQGRAELQQRQHAVQRLARDERQLRESTRRERFMLVGLIVLVILIIVALVVFFVVRPF